ncbi:rhodanese-related sulfurtransferase [Rhodoferax ferrireducens]|uniref:Rhodanese-related sulfurtransferase n=1 Tax=Rhodoferax ferrireducens TaxID=192843 RepID=A0ABU2CAP2_9BURK|nr:rhodanese-like domain-containing protein [Rhodoferax ferrireducens]MDR7378399.1 rhodanese-related sulfurtransferase [Rhodoferax ferrireducens]
MDRTPANIFPSVAATILRDWLNDGREIALLDVREAGQFGEGHPFFAVPLPYSRLELDVASLVPRSTTRVVLVDAGDGVAERAAARLAFLGYTQVFLLAGGAPGWAAAGYVLFQGVNLPSKTFGELVEHAYATPHLSAQDLRARQQAGEPLVLLDGRTFEEHRKMSIPGAVSVPNGELALRWRALLPDVDTPVVIHCAGRTRSIIGAQILRSLGIPNPVLALENGTQGWALEGLQLEHGNERRSAGAVAAHPDDRIAAANLAQSAGVHKLSAAQAQAWLDDPQRTTYVLDVRSAEEFAAGSLAGAKHAPGGQLLQATDQSIAVRNSRVILLDDEAIRAPVVAAWLRRLGFETAVVDGGVRAAIQVRVPPLAVLGPVPAVNHGELPSWVARQAPLLLDLQPSMAYRSRHARGAHWTLRPHLVADARATGKPGQPILLFATDAAVAGLAAADLHEAGWRDVRWTRLEDWVAAGLPAESSPGLPADAEAIDYLFFVHDRHEGNLDAARRYLAWETGLIAQCSPDELAVFRLPEVR